MPQTYSVRVVSNKEFDHLAGSDNRYKYVDEDNFGFADPDNRVAYVRHVAMPELQKFLISHEFEHLLNPENHADRDPNGIYHKKGFSNLFGGGKQKKQMNQQLAEQGNFMGGEMMHPDSVRTMLANGPPGLGQGMPDTSWISKLDSPDSRSPIAGGMGGAMATDLSSGGRSVSGLREALMKRGLING